MRKIRNFLCFFICSFHLNCPTMEEQITDRQVLLGVTRNIVQASEEEKFLFILPSAADVRTLKYLALIGMVVLQSRATGGLFPYSLCKIA